LGPMDDNAPNSKTVSLAIVYPIVQTTTTGGGSAKAPKRKGTHKPKEEAN